MQAEDDYYKLLDVERGATEEEIKKAYKRQALKFHPDHNQTKEAAEKFHLINEAYEVLTNPAKRERYDRFGKAGLDPNASANPGPSIFVDESRFGNGFFETLFGGGFNNVFGAEDSANPLKTDDYLINIDVELKDLYNGCTKKYSYKRTIICPKCHASGAESSEHVIYCKGCKGGGKRILRRTLPRGIVQQFMTVCSDCEGRGQFITQKCSTCKGRKLITQDKVLTVKIKPGMRDGHKIVLPREADESPGKVTGDLIFVIKQIPNSTFKRVDNDLIVEQTITLLEALTGFNLKIQTLDGRWLEVEVDEVIQPGHHKAILNEGMPLYKQEKEGHLIKGSLVVVFQVAFPSHLNMEVKQYLRLLMDPKINSQQTIPTLEEMRKIASLKDGKKVSLVTSSLNEKPSGELTKVKFLPGHYGSSKPSQRHVILEDAGDTGNKEEIDGKKKSKKSFCAMQ